MREQSVKATTSLSVIVPAFNEQHLVVMSLDRLRFLAETPHLDRVKVIVVDDGSTDGTAAALEKYRRHLGEVPGANVEWIFLRHASNQGKAAAIRTGLAHADTELTAIHDADL